MICDYVFSFNDHIICFWFNGVISTYLLRSFGFSWCWKWLSWMFNENIWSVLTEQPNDKMRLWKKFCFPLNDNINIYTKWLIFTLGKLTRKFTCLEVSHIFCFWLHIQKICVSSAHFCESCFFRVCLKLTLLLSHRPNKNRFIRWVGPINLFEKFVVETISIIIVPVRSNPIQFNRFGLSTDYLRMPTTPKRF